MDITPELNQWLKSNIADNGHHILSPSGYSGWSKCTGMMRELSEARTKSEDNIASVEGTLGHYLLEICILTWTSPLLLTSTPQHIIVDALKWASKVSGNKNNSDEVKGFIAKCYVELSTCTFTNAMREEIEKCYQRILVYKVDGWEVLPEGKVTLESYFGHNHCDGTSDIIMYKGTHLIVADLKYGKGIEVSPDYNGQAQLYSGGACSMLWKLGISVDQITIVIMQPRINNGVWKVWETNYNELYKFLMIAKDKSIEALLVLGGQNPEQFAPNEKSCQWCHRKMNCKPRADFALDSVKQAFKDAGVIEGVPISPVDLSTDVLSSILLRTPFITTFLNDIGKEAVTRAKKGIKVPYYKMVKGRSSRTWKEQSVKNLLDLFVSLGLLPTDCMSSAIKSPAQIAKLKLTPVQKKSIKDMTSFSFGNNTLVPETDKRDAVMDAVDMFKAAGIGI